MIYCDQYWDEIKKKIRQTLEEPPVTDQIFIK